LQIAQILLDAGAEIDAMADMYGGSTTLGLIATSIHPLLAGVQPALIETFIERGARVDGGFEEENTGGYTRGAVNGCLANGRFEAAELLARRGARLDLEGAAGLGRLDLVKSFFNDDGGLKPTATGEQLKMGFIWACEYGQREVVEFLLRRGIKPGEKHRGQTGLHWAAIGGHAGLVKLLIDHKFPADQKDDEHEGTPLGWALFGWGNKSDEAPSDGFYQSVELLVAAGAPVEPGHLAWVRVRADPRMLAALEGKQPSGVRLEI
jgi:ankyrin repeat protein